MQNISGYLGNYDEEIIDTQNNIAVNSCGHYRLKNLEKFETWRPFGRQDYQLIYLAGGSADFYVDEQKTELSAESIIIFYPGEKQHYIYEKENNPDIYWIHFSGLEADALLKDAGLFPAHIITVTALKESTFLFDRIIRELQLKRDNFQSLIRLYFQEILLLISRNLKESSSAIQRSKIVEQAIIDFHKNYQSPISIQEYADDSGITCCWFIRDFKQHTGTTPGQYITDIRINKAMDLLRDGTFNVTETAAFVGYDNPLYFSRLFKKHTGLSPREYMKTIK